MKAAFFLAGAFLLSGTLRAQLNISDCTPENSMVSQQELNSNATELYKPCLLFDDNNYTLISNQGKILQAINSIDFQSPFYGKPTGSGSIHLKVGNKGDFDVFCMNYPDLLHVLRYKKLELGMTLPMDIQEKITNFHNGTEPKINPYLDWNIRVTADFTHPNWPGTISIDGFYNKEFTEWMTPIDQVPAIPGGYTNAQYRALGGYTEIPTDQPFLFRFSPNLLGKWSCTVHIYLPGQEAYHSDPFSFTVVESNSPGYVTVSPNKRYLELGGQPFYPVGCNILWPITRQETDPMLYGKTGVYEEYRDGVYALPHVYDNYKNTLNALIDGGGNCFRTIMYPASTEIEFEKLGDYTDRLAMAQEMDEILELCENRGALLLWDLQIHYTLMYSEMAYHKNWAWDNQVVDAEGNAYDYCYKNIPGIGNPMDFFTNEEAKAYYKQRLRYIMARWGYSTNISMFEVMSETNLVVPTKQQGFYSQGENWKIYSRWNVEMASYIKSQHNGALHLVTTSYAGEKKPEDNTFFYDVFDVMSVNLYDFGRPDFGSFLVESVNKRLLNEDDQNGCYTWHNIEGERFRHVKPLIFSETGVLDKNCPNTLEPQRFFNEELKLMYQLPFSGLAGGFSWNFWFHPDLFHHLGKIRQAIYNVPRLSSGNWHPGAMKALPSLITEKWEYHKPWADAMVDEFDPPGGGESNIRDRRADLVYLRSGDKNFATGMITNKTLNFLTLEDCFDSQYLDSIDVDLDENRRWKDYHPVILSPLSSFSVWGEEMELSGLRNNDYYLNYYNPANLSSPIDVQDDNGENIRLSCTMYNEYLVFEARRQGHSWEQPLYEDSIRGNEAGMPLTKNTGRSNPEPVQENYLSYDILVFPNPTAGQLTIQLAQNHVGSEMQLTDLRGVVLDTRRLSFEKNAFSLNDIKPGAYLLRVKLPDEAIKIFKIEKL